MYSYDNAVENVAKQYEKRIVDALEQVKSALADVGIHSMGPDEMFGATFTWSLWVDPPSSLFESDYSYNIDIELNDSKDFEGTEEGVNFGLVVTCVTGEILFDWHPFNYTTTVWVPVDNEAAIQDRWDEFMQDWRGRVHAIVATIDDALTYE